MSNRRTINLRVTRRTCYNIAHQPNYRNLHHAFFVDSDVSSIKDMYPVAQPTFSVMEQDHIFNKVVN